MSVNETTTVLLVDDHQLVRELCRDLLAADPAIKVVGEAADGLQAVHLAHELQPDVIVMDVTMPGMGGIEATRLIAGSCRHTRILCLSMHTNPTLAAAMMNAGAAGYFCKTGKPRELAAAIRKIAAGATYLDPAVAATLATTGNPDHPHTPLMDTLSAREKDVLRLIADGHNTATIATQLGITPATVCSHRINLSKKLRIDSVAELTKLAIREGISTI